MKTITVHDGQGRNPTTLTRQQYTELQASGMLWEFHPDAPLHWPHAVDTTEERLAIYQELTAEECAEKNAAQEENAKLRDALGAVQTQVYHVAVALENRAPEEAERLYGVKNIIVAALR